MDSEAEIGARQVLPVGADPIPAFGGGLPVDLREQMGRAVNAWLLRTPSRETRRAYESDLGQFLRHAGIQSGAWEQLAAVRPESTVSRLPGALPLPVVASGQQARCG